MWFVGSLHSMSDDWTSNKSKNDSQEQNVSDAQSFATSSFNGIGLNDSGGRQYSHYFENASSIPVFPGHSCD